MFFIDKDGNGRYDPGEQVVDKEVYHKSRTQPLPTRTDANGHIVIPDLRIGDTLFVRHSPFSMGAVISKRPLWGTTDEFAGSMFDLYFDTDTVSGTGEIVSKTISAADAEVLNRGDALPVPLTHPVFSWNLTVAVDWPAQPAEIDSLKQCFRKASHLLFDVTDGHMKLGRVEIHNDAKQGSGLQYADVIAWNSDGEPCAHLNGVRAADQWIFLYRATQIPSSDANVGRFVHELCHYLLGLDEEYQSGNGSQVLWHVYHRSCYLAGSMPRSFGIMDEFTVDTELSSNNDYASADSYIGASPARVTSQIWTYSLGEWARTSTLLAAPV